MYSPSTPSKRSWKLPKRISSSTKPVQPGRSAAVKPNTLNPRSRQASTNSPQAPENRMRRSPSHVATLSGMSVKEKSRRRTEPAASRSRRLPVARAGRSRERPLADRPRSQAPHEHAVLGHGGDHVDDTPVHQAEVTRVERHGDL
jgi:hypothetical protein